MADFEDVELDLSNVGRFSSPLRCAGSTVLRAEQRESKANIILDLGGGDGRTNERARPAICSCQRAAVARRRFRRFFFFPSLHQPQHTHQTLATTPTQHSPVRCRHQVQGGRGDLQQ